MNELYNSTEKKHSSRRRWIYLTAAMIVLCVLMAMPGAKTARLEMVIARDNPIEVVLTPPKDCRLERVYLKANEFVPRTGKLVTLVVNEIKFPVEDWEKLPSVKVDSDPGFENRNAPIAWEKLKGAKSLKVYCEDLNEKLARHDLALVFEITGNPDKVKNWQSFVTLHSKNEPLLIKKSAPEQK